MVSLNYRTSIAHHAAIQAVPPLLPMPRTRRAPSPVHVQFFRMKRDHNKGFYSEKC